MSRRRDPVEPVEFRLSRLHLVDPRGEFDEDLYRGTRVNYRRGKKVYKSGFGNISELRRQRRCRV